MYKLLEKHLISAYIFKMFFVFWPIIFETHQKCVQRAPPLNFYLRATGPPPCPHNLSTYSYLCTYISEHLFGKISHIDPIISWKWPLYQIIYIGCVILKINILFFKQLILKVICRRQFFLYFSIPYMYVYQLMCIAACTVHTYIQFSILHTVNAQGCWRNKKKKKWILKCPCFKSLEVPQMVLYIWHSLFIW